MTLAIFQSEGILQLCRHRLKRVVTLAAMACGAIDNAFASIPSGPADFFVLSGDSASCTSSLDMSENSKQSFRSAQD